MYLYSIFDKQAKTYGPVFSMLNHVNARRYVEGLVHQDKSVEHDYKNDFRLDCIGVLNDSSGEIKSHITEVIDLGSIE